LACHVKAYQLTQPVPDLSGWERSLVKGIAMHDLVTASIRIGKFIDDLVKITESQIGRDTGELVAKYVLLFLAS
jgi:hypothetical protein